MGYGDQSSEPGKGGETSVDTSVPARADPEVLESSSLTH